MYKRKDLSVNSSSIILQHSFVDIEIMYYLLFNYCKVENEKRGVKLIDLIVQNPRKDLKQHYFVRYATPNVVAATEA